MNTDSKFDVNTLWNFFTRHSIIQYMTSQVLLHFIWLSWKCNFGKGYLLFFSATLLEMCCTLSTLCFWAITPYHLVNSSWHFRGTCPVMWRHIPDEHSHKLCCHENLYICTLLDNKSLLSHAQVTLQIHAEKHVLGSLSKAVVSKILKFRPLREVWFDKVPNRVFKKIVVYWNTKLCSYNKTNKMHYFSNLFLE